MGRTWSESLPGTCVPWVQRLAPRGPGSRLLNECLIYWGRIAGCAQPWARAPSRVRLLSLDCPQNRFGMSCEQVCSCRNGGLCHAANGSCTCGLGWTGPRCERGECPGRLGG